MVIYGEYLFIENLITGILILLLTGKICGLRRERWRVAAGGVLCGMFSFVIFISMSIPVSLAVKTAFSLLVVLATFPELLSDNNIPGNNAGIFTGNNFRGNNIAQHIGRKHRPVQIVKDIAKAVLVFYIVSFVMGGLTIAVIGMSGVKGITANGYVYTGAPTYAKIALGVTLTYIALEYFVRLIRGKINAERLLREVRIRLGDEEFSLSAYTDTGNHLKDPVMGRPVSVISRSAADALFIVMPEEEMTKRYCAVPYKAAGTENGIMDGFRVDEMCISGGNRSILYRSSIFAIYEGDFKERDGVSGFDVLLNREIIEGGVI